MGRLKMAMRGATAAAAAFVCAAAMAAGGPPDFTGVWTNATPATGGTAMPNTGALPLTEYGRARVEAYRKLTDGTDDSPGRWCVGTGMPGSMLGSGAYPMEIIQRPEQITIIYEAHTEVRRVYIGDRNAPPEDRIPGRNGYSSGRWEGDVLVVETDNLVDQVDQRSTPHSEEAKIIERYSLDGTDAQGRRILKAEMTMIDPKFYTQPVVMTKRWAEVPNGRLLPYECPEEMWLDRIAEIAKERGVPNPFDPDSVKVAKD
jgi:hypothetical protein